MLDTRALPIQRALWGAVAALASGLCCAGPPERVPSKPGPRMQDVESEVYSSPASMSELTTRAQLCIVRVVRFDGPDSGKSVIASSSPETAGLIVANSRLDIRHGLMQSLVQSTLTFEAREGRFRMTHSDLRRAQRISGTGAPYNEFEPMAADGSFSVRTAEAIKKQFAAIAECVQKPASTF